MAIEQTLEPFGKYLRRKRQELGLTQADIEERGGPSQTYLSDIEASAETETPKMPSRKMLAKIAQAMNIPSSEIESAAHLKSGALAATRQTRPQTVVVPDGMTPITLSTGEIWMLRSDNPDPDGTIAAVETAIAVMSHQRRGNRSN